MLYSLTFWMFLFSVLKMNHTMNFITLIYYFVLQRSEKIKSLQEQCQFYEMKCSQTMKHAEELPKIQQELENREAALNAVSFFTMIIILCSFHMFIVFPFIYFFVSLMNLSIWFENVFKVFYKLLFFSRLKRETSQLKNNCKIYTCNSKRLVLTCQE